MAHNLSNAMDDLRSPDQRAATKSDVARPLPAKITNAPKRAGLPSGATHRVMVPLKHRAQFFRQFATCIHAGLSLGAALKHLEQETWNRDLKEAARKAYICVERGGKLSAWMTTRPAVFSRAEAAMVMAGETSGNLDDTLDYIANDLEDELKLKKRLALATFTTKWFVLPSLVLSAGTANILNYSMDGMAKVGAGASEAQQQQAAISAGLHGYLHDLMLRLPWVALCLVLWYFLPLLMDLHPALQRIRDQAILWVPGLGGLRRDQAISRYLIALSHLTAAGLTPGPALEACAGAAGNQVLDDKFNVAAAQARAGNLSVAAALEGSGIFRRDTLSLLRTGEQAGSMPEMLQRSAAYYTSGIQTRLVSVPKIIGIAAVLIAGIGTCYVVATDTKQYFDNIFTGVDKFMDMK